jgi:hypothetical protein
MGAGLTVAKKTGPKPSSEGPRTDLIAFKCRAAYKAWVVKLAKKHRTTPSDLIDRALVRFAAEDGFEEAPER